MRKIKMMTQEEIIGDGTRAFLAAPTELKGVNPNGMRVGWAMAAQQWANRVTGYEYFAPENHVAMFESDGEPYNSFIRWSGMIDVFGDGELVKVIEMYPHGCWYIRTETGNGESWQYFVAPQGLIEEIGPRINCRAINRYSSLVGDDDSKEVVYKDFPA
jgi:hypothetical protein